MLPRNREALAADYPLFLKKVSIQIEENSLSEFCQTCDHYSLSCPWSQIDRIVNLATSAMPLRQNQADTLAVDEVNKLPVLKSLANLCIESLISGGSPITI